jgi:DNA-binding IclR family transcriptional regulator
MSVAELVQETGGALSTVYQLLNQLLNNDEVILSGHGRYALHGAAPVYVPTTDAIISTLGKKPMKLDPLVQYINKQTNFGCSRATVARILVYLKEKGLVKRGGRQEAAKYSLTQAGRTRADKLACGKTAAGRRFR